MSNNNRLIKVIIQRLGEEIRRGRPHCCASVFWIRFFIDEVLAEKGVVLSEIEKFSLALEVLSKVPAPVGFDENNEPIY